MKNTKIKLYIKIITLTIIVMLFMIAGNAGATTFTGNDINTGASFGQNKINIRNEVYNIEKNTREVAAVYASKFNIACNNALELAHDRYILEEKQSQIENAIENDRIMFIGNSLVEGLRLNNDSKNQFYCKVGISLNGLQSKIYSQIDNADFDVAIIEMGTNELGSWNSEEFKSSYTDLIDRILSNNPSAQVFCLSIPPLSSSRDTSGGRFNNKNAKTYNSYIESVANSFDQTTFIDCSIFFGDVLNSEWTGDGIHLSGRIYRDWYNWIIETIRNNY